MIVNVETVYRVRVDYDCVEDSKGECALDRVELKAVALADYYSTTWDCFSGGAACHPYIIFEGMRDDVQKAGNALVQYIKRFKSYKFIV